MKFLTLLVFFALFAGLTSCLPDAAATLSPEVVEVVEQADVTTNFSVNGTGLEIGHGYLFKVSEDEAGAVKHHLVLTSGEVQEQGAFTGTSEAVTITITAAENADLSGQYILGYDGADIGLAAAGRYYQNLRFSQSTNYAQGNYDLGSVVISRDEEEYTISLNLSTSTGGSEVKGTFKGAISEIDLIGSEPIDDTLFQGANQLKYGERVVGLNHAYLVEYGNENSGSRRYRLYLSEEDIAPDASTLTGRSDLIFFYINDEVIEKGGKYTFAPNSNDYLSRFIERVNSGYYCQNMDFRQNSADEDVPMDKAEVNILVDGEEIVIAFSGQAITRKTTSGLYRGPIVRLD